MINLKGKTFFSSLLFESLKLYFIFFFHIRYLIFNICEINPINKSELIVLSCASSIIITEYSDKSESFSNSFNNIPSVTNLISVSFETFSVSYLTWYPIFNPLFIDISSLRRKAKALAATRLG